MPQVKFEKQIPLSTKDAFDKLKDLLKNASDLKKIDPEIELDVQESKKSVQAKGSKINGDVSIHPDGSQPIESHSVVKIDLNIPWTYAPFRSIIQKKLEEKIDELKSGSKA